MTTETSTGSYTRTICVNATPERAYAALTAGYDHWWTTADNTFDRPGARIKFTFAPNKSYWTFEAQILEPNQRVVLRCVDAYHIMTDKPEASTSEWLGTTVRWHIESTGEQTVIRFEHDGLTPALACYEVCEAGWDLFFVDSLKAYLNTGVGTPHRGQ